MAENNDCVKSEHSQLLDKLQNKEDIPIGGLEIKKETNIELSENEKGEGNNSRMLTDIISENESACLMDHAMPGHENHDKSDVFENTHVIVLNKYDKFNARSKPEPNKLKHKCDRCEEAFQFPYQLARHKTFKHEGKYPYSCEICKKPFDRISSLKDHMYVHTENRPYECIECGKKFKMNGNLKKHIRDIHTQKDEPNLMFQCEYCSKTFPTKERLTSHFVVHDNDKAFSCNVCGKKFNRKSNLKEHVVIHSTEKNFVCPDCGMRFNRKYSLKIHARNHMEVKPYKCEVCPSSFSQLHALKTHIRLHTGEKPFKCSICEKTFRQLATLQVHLKRHTGVKDFKCEICGKGFVIKRRLIEHERLHTGEKPFACDVCPYRTATATGLRHHKKTHKRQMERLGISSIKQLLTDGCKSLSPDGRKRKVKLSKPKPTITNLNKESVQVENVDFEKSFDNKTDEAESIVIEQINDNDLSTESQSAAAVIYQQSGHVIEIVNDLTDSFSADISNDMFQCSNDGDKSDDNDLEIRHGSEDDSHATETEDVSLIEFEYVAKEILYKYLSEFIPVIDSDVLTHKVNEMAQELSENHFKLLNKNLEQGQQWTKYLAKNNYDTNDDRNRGITADNDLQSDINLYSFKPTETQFKHHNKLSAGLTLTSKIQSLNKNGKATDNCRSLDVELSNTLNESISRSHDKNVSNTQTKGDSDKPYENVSKPPFGGVKRSYSERFGSKSRKTTIACADEQTNLEKYDNKNVSHSSTFESPLAKTEPLTTQEYVVRKEINPISTNAFTVLKDMLSAPPKQYLISTRNSSAALKHSINLQNKIASSNSRFEGIWHTPGWSESNFNWIDEDEFLRDINSSIVKIEPVSP